LVQLDDLLLQLLRWIKEKRSRNVEDFVDIRPSAEGAGEGEKRKKHPDICGVAPATLFGGLP
jgi:hypothetical protein